MKQINLVSITFTCLITLASLKAQNINSIQFLGGIISPMHSFDGIGGIAQYERKLDSVFSIYGYVGIYTWDKNRINFIEAQTSVQRTTLFQSYSTDEHELLPFYIGSKLNFHTNKYFTTFLNIEIGYSLLSYFDNKNLKSIDPSTGEVLNYYAVRTSREKKRENLIGFGFGAGIYRPLSGKFGLIFAYKLNTHLNSSYNGFYETKGTYSQFLAGFNFNI